MAFSGPMTRRFSPALAEPSYRLGRFGSHYPIGADPRCRPITPSVPRRNESNTRSGNSRLLANCRLWSRAFSGGAGVRRVPHSHCSLPVNSKN
jgi:hypothetical protein